MPETTIAVPGGIFDSTTVTETVGGFPRGDKAVNAEFIAGMISCFYTDGVYEGGDNFRVTPFGGGMDIRVDAGTAWIRGYMARMTSAQVFTLSAGKTYSVFLRLNSASGEFRLVLDEPEREPEVSANIRELKLAGISVPSGAGNITVSMITDKRSDSSVCGIVTSTIDALGTVETARNALSLGGLAASCYLKKSGGTMTGALRASPDSTGAGVVRNISYGTELPRDLPEGEVFILIDEV